MSEPFSISPLAIAHCTGTFCTCMTVTGGVVALNHRCPVHSLPSQAYADTVRLEELRKVEALEQLHLIVAAYGEPLVLRWVKSVAAMQSGTGL